MPRKSQENEVRAEVEAYLAPALADLKGDARPLTVSAIARVHERSRETYYRYNLNERIDAVRKERERVQGGGRPKSSTHLKLEEARKDARHWEEMYRSTLERLVLIENHLRRHPTTDLDQIYRGMKKPNRSEPA